MKGGFGVRAVTGLMVVLLAFSMWAGPAAGQSPTQALKRLSLEELLRVEVSTVSRVPEATATLPAAVFVITQDDIRRSGATTLPEALRLAPGLQISRIDGARYAVGMRGFPDRLSRSMLVLMDGRAVYSPLFAGTYWEVQDTLLEDIDRIEVIRGPGGTLWGANAVNGIINVVTKPAEDTQGALVSGSFGSDVRGPLALRYGWAAGPNGHLRAYVRATDRDPFATGPLAADAFRIVQGGFRGDWHLARSRRLTVQGDAYAADLAQTFNVLIPTAPFARATQRTSPLSGGNALLRWNSPWRRGRLQVQSYVDRTARDERPVGETRQTFDLDLQLQYPLWSRHALVIGGGYRVTSGRIMAVPPSAFVPEVRTDNLYSALVHDDITLVADRVRLLVGTKVEHNAYSGVVWQPSGRLTWSINRSNTLVSSITRAQRTPSRVETDYTTASVSTPSIPSFVRLLPNPDFRPESLVAYEVGHRVRAGSSLFVTTSAFFNSLDHMLSTELQTPFAETEPTPRLILPVTFANGLRGHSHGLEVTGDLRAAPWWRWTANYSYLRVALERKPGSADVSQERRNEGLSPRHQVQVGSSVDLPRAVSVDWALRYISALPVGAVPAYATSNVRFAWTARPSLEVAVVGQNLHEGRHVEWGAGASSVEVRRAAYVNVTWRPGRR